MAVVAAIHDRPIDAAVYDGDVIGSTNNVCNGL